MEDLVDQEVIAAGMTKEQLHDIIEAEDRVIAARQQFEQAKSYIETRSKIYSMLQKKYGQDAQFIDVNEKHSLDPEDALFKRVEVK